MPDGAPPSLEQAFGSLNYNLKQKVDVCASKQIPYAVTTNAKGQVDSSWSDADVEQALMEQCDEMLPALLDEQKNQKQEEAAKKKEEKEKKKEEEKKKREEKAAAEKKRKEEAEKKRIADKEKREEAAAKKKEDDKKREKERQKKAAEDEKKRKAAAKEKKAADKEKAKEKAKSDSEKRKQKAADDKRRYEENERKKKENDKKKKEQAKKREAERKVKDKERKVKKAKEDEKKREKREEKKRKQQEELEKEWSPEDGIDYWEKDYTEDTCCNEQGFQCCRSLAYVTYFLIFPPLFGLMVFIEYELFGWARFAARFAGEGYNLTDFNQPSPAPMEGEAMPIRAGAPTPEPVATSKMFFDFVEENPLTWGLPMIGFMYGIFANIVPMCPGVVLVPLFQELGVSKHAHSTTALVSAVQVVGSGVLGFTAWCGRDARFFICRALFLLTPCAWVGYVIGVTNNLTFKDMLEAMNEDTDDPGVRADLDKASLDLLHTYLRMALGVFMCVMAVVCFIGLFIGGVNRICCPSKTGGSTPGCKSFCQWIIAMCCSFNTGWAFTATIGSGMGMFTFFVLSLFLGVETKRAMPTAIVIGGWTQILPVFFNMVFRGELPYIRLMTMIPGMWFGTVLAPWFSHCGGPQSDLAIYFMCLAAIGVSTVIYGAIKMDKMKEDVDLDVGPMYAIPALDQFFADDVKERL
eukprot:CAMPEP_0172584424 /NCGR_PEP_ID=MMETSP1068-20121228/4018_1 /TAXON_ID=35684 /ORGANISM="Pseudopedinella elastica, Strain CCMP716" /LENGTH=691 /DNA_ID=CAMNT_0013378599 /DNA_START=66 /DNA_END=2141 /DNA_ORIENTATION=+